MSKMAPPFKVQKPGKKQAKNSSAEQLIKATDTGLGIGKLTLGDIQDIIQKTNVLQNLGGTNKPVDDDSSKTNFEGSSTVATKANTKPGNARNPARDGKGAFLHLGQNGSNSLRKEEHKSRQKLSNLKGGPRCHNEARVTWRQPGERAEMPNHSLNGQQMAEMPLHSPYGQGGLEQSVGWSAALWPCGPDARPQTGLPGRSNSPDERRKCLVDGAVSLEEPEKAHKPGQRRQVSIRVSKVSITENRPERAQQENDPHGLLTHGPKWTSKQNGF
jgi:hypothetical protein